MKKTMRVLAAWAGTCWRLDRYSFLYNAVGTLLAVGGIVGVSAVFGLVLRLAGAG